MCTKPPNWDTPEVSIGDVGFLRYQDVIAGDTYYDLNLDKEVKYKYSNRYFINFVKKEDNFNKETIIL